VVAGTDYAGAWSAFWRGSRRIRFTVTAKIALDFRASSLAIRSPTVQIQLWPTPAYASYYRQEPGRR
jgi:hypothetical protein